MLGGGEIAVRGECLVKMAEKGECWGGDSREGRVLVGKINNT